MNGTLVELGNLTGEQRKLFELLLRKEGLDLERLPIAPRTVGSPAPLSWTQQRLWSAGLLAPGVAYGNVEMAFWLRGPLDIQALRESCQELARRHEILRTSFQNIRGRAEQVIHPEGSVRFEQIDLRNYPAGQRESEALRRATEEVRKPFDLEKESLWRLLLERLAEEDYLVVLTTHHLISDGWGMRVLLRELSILYQARVTGEAAALEPLPVQYADYALWQRQWSKSEALEEQLNYWDKQLDGAAEELDLPMRQRRVSAPTYRSGTYTFELSRELTTALRELSRSEGVTLYTSLLTAFQALLYGYSGRHDVLVGTTVSNRNRSETEGMIGNFGNNLLLRLNVSDEPSFRELLGRTREMVLAATAHQDLPLEELMERWESKGKRVPQFQTMFMVRDSTLEENFQLHGLRVESVHVDVGIAPLELKVDLIEGPEQIRGAVEYQVDVYEGAGIRQMVKDYQGVVEKMVAQPEERIGVLSGLMQTRAGTARIIEGKKEEKPSHVRARDKLEVQLVAIWEKVLGRHPIGIRDNFFAVGGTSLLAVKLFAHLEKEVGRNLPLATLFQAPTIEKLGDVLRHEGWKPSWSSLVPIQPEGTHPPLYCVHGGGGNVLTFEALSRHLGREQPLYGLQSPGLDGRPPYTRLEDMAEHYLRDIRALQPKGPYYLEGMSFGGLVAFEMAQQLLKQGEEVGLLALLDTYPTGYRQLLPDMTLYRRIELRIADLLTVKPKDKRRFLRSMLKSGRKKIFSTLTGLVRKRRSEAETRTAHAIRTVREANFIAAINYVPKPYPGRATLFWASESFIHSTHKFRAAWNILVPSGLETHVVPGAHITMFEEPYVKVLADKITESLEKARHLQAKRSQTAVAH